MTSDKLINASDIKLGNTNVQALYIGSKKLWERGEIFPTFELNPVVVESDGMLRLNYFKYQSDIAAGITTYTMTGNSTCIFKASPGIKLSDSQMLMGTWAVAGVAAVAAISMTNPRMPETMEAEQLSKMNDKGQIKDCIVDGPLSLDLAISPESAKIKHSNRKINGDADIILFPDVHAANIAYKILTHLSNAKSGNIIIGTRQPVILSSRSDTVEVKLNSIILGFTYYKFKGH